MASKRESIRYRGHLVALTKDMLVPLTEDMVEPCRLEVEVAVAVEVAVRGPLGDAR